MPQLPSNLGASPWRSEGRTLSFDRTEDVIQWAERESQAWQGGKDQSVPTLRKEWAKQWNELLRIAQSTRQLESQLALESEPERQQQVEATMQKLRSQFATIQTGRLLTTDSPHFPSISRLMHVDGDAACVLMIASKSDGQAIMQGIQGGALWAAISLIAPSLAEGDDSTLRDTHLRELAYVKNAFEKELDSVRNLAKQEFEKAAQRDKEQESQVRLHTETWAGQLKNCTLEWEEMRNTYNEKLALLAPTDYWRKRSKGSKWTAIWFAGAFAATLGTMLWLFFSLGVSLLADAKGIKDASITVTILPVIIPAFAGVWVLRILGRQLAESLSIYKDAQERETLVLTFLAMMRDEKAGKAVIKDEDRALILHALFRPSRVTAADDSPPINILEALLGKSGK